MINVEMLGLASSLVFGISRTKKDQDRRLRVFCKKGPRGMFLYCTFHIALRIKRGILLSHHQETVFYIYVGENSTYFVTYPQ